MEKTKIWRDGLTSSIYPEDVWIQDKNGKYHVNPNVEQIILEKIGDASYSNKYVSKLENTVLATDKADNYKSDFYSAA